MVRFRSLSRYSLYAKEGVACTVLYCTVVGQRDEVLSFTTDGLSSKNNVFELMLGESVLPCILLGTLRRIVRSSTIP